MITVAGADVNTTSSEGETPLMTIARAGTVVFSVEFAARGFGPSRRQEFKIVAAIDQSGNEGRPVQPTKARVDGVAWKVTLLRAGTPVRDASWSDLRCPSARALDERIGFSR